MHFPSSPDLALRRTVEEDLDFVVAAENHPENRPYVFQWSRERHRAALANGDLRHLILDALPERRPVGYAILAGIERLLVEFIRTNEAVLWGLTEQQLIAIAMIVVGAAGVWWFETHGRLRPVVAARKPVMPTVRTSRNSTLARRRRTISRWLTLCRCI
mgnify:CR=1 FL=1